MCRPFQNVPIVFPVCVARSQFFQFVPPLVFPAEGKYLMSLLSLASESMRKCEEMVSPRWKGIRPNRVDFVKICSDFFKIGENGTLGFKYGLLCGKRSWGSKS